jgi:WD40 repeat protein/DNA-directed RNA polymerase subunit RPC12/RpoP
MIKFSCKKCGQKLNVEDKHSGKRVKCPKCGSVGVVPDISDKIMFHCKNCGQSISVPQIHAGKKGKCPKCKNQVVVPSVKGGPAEFPSEADQNQYEEESDVSEKGTGVDRHLIFVISGVALVVVLGLIILVTVILPSGSKRIEELAVPMRQEVGDTDFRPQPAISDTQPTESIVQKSPKKDISQTESVSLENVNKIAFASDRDGNYEIYIMNEDGSGLKRLTNNPDEDVFPSWSPDGRKIAFESRRDGNPEIYVMNADGSEQTNLTNSTSWDQFPSWSPDGQNIAFHSLRDENHEIYTMNSDGSELKRLTNNSNHDMGPSWSPDGRKIAFFAQRDGNPEIYIMNPDGSEQTRLTNNSAHDMSPAWSPDGKKIAFVSDRDTNFEIYVMNSDGSEQRRLTKNSVNDENPSWSSDGKKIVFVSNRDGNREIYVMNADGSEQKRLTNNPAEDRFPCWLPILASRSRSLEELESRRDRQEITDIEVRSQSVSSEQNAAARKIDLKLRLKPKQKHRLRLYREYNSSFTISGQQHDSGDIHTTELEFEVEQVDANNVTSLRVTYIRINAISKTEQENREYDSGKPDTVGDNVFGPIFCALIGRSFVVKVTSEGKIVKLEGLAEMYQQMAEPLVEYEDEAIRQRYAGMETKDSEEDVKRQIDRANQKYGSRDKRIEATREGLDKGPYSREENIRDMLDNVIMSFPGGPVGIGDSWMAPFFMGDMELGDCTYTLRETNQTAVLVDTSLKIEVNNVVPAPADGSRGSSRKTLTGSGKGSIDIDLSTGWMLRKNVTLSYSGETKTAPTERNPRGTTTAQSMENITIVEPIE